MLKVEIPKTKERLIRQIEALKYQLTQDTREEDRKIHQEALEDSEKALKEWSEE
jgi:hypothetical protein